MAKKKIRAPAKIEWTLRFKNRCIYCGRVIHMTETICSKCKVKRKKEGKFL